jgi:hypothetical protein
VSLFRRGLCQQASIERRPIFYCVFLPVIPTYHPTCGGVNLKFNEQMDRLFRQPNPGNITLAECGSDGLGTFNPANGDLE